MNQNLSLFLNASRWVAALLVLISHVRYISLVDLKNALNPTLPVKGVYFITGLGHESVVVFFVISGFLVGGLSLDRWRTRGPDLRVYFSARISRLYTVLIPALVLGLALDFIGLHWFNASELYTSSARYHTPSLNRRVDEALNLPTFVGNLFMLQGILTERFGSNSPLWSLSYEWWYYCIFALAGMALTGTGRWRFACGLAAVVLASVMPARLLVLGLVWLLGIAAHAWVRSRWWRPHPLLGIGLFVVALAISRVSHNQNNVDAPESLLSTFSRDFGLGVTYVLALVSASRLTMQLPFARLHERLADFSYTTYLCHFPAMLFIVAVAYQVFGIRFQWQPTAAGLTYLLTLSVALCAYCFVLSELTERHTAVVRRKLDRVLGVPQRVAAAAG